ncbi:DUF742 domain-containing protein [Streptomyces sp. MS19]|uniref:DUF742 domain-containing protein n=1 Tax=Streptomyces sp. MS19 TaxID=3385972 RepID=UPI00399F5176
MTQQDGPGGGRPVPLYVVTGGCGTAPRGRDPLALDLVTLVVTRTSPVPSGMAPEAGALLRACRYPLSAAEISAYLGLPFGVLTVLLTALEADGHVELRQTRDGRQDTADTDTDTLKALIDGLQRL